MAKNQTNLTRREFVAAGCVVAAGATLGSGATKRKDESIMRIGSHTEALNQTYWNFEK